MSKILALGCKKPWIIVSVWIESGNLGGSGGDVDVVWKGMEGFTGLRVPDSAAAACGRGSATDSHSLSKIEAGYPLTLYHRATQ